MSHVLDSLRGTLIVSCQAYDGEPLLDPEIMAKVAQSAVSGGAAGIRAKGLADLRAMRAVVSEPIIGLVKVGKEGVFITPTLDDARAVADTGCEIVAIDGTTRPRPDRLSLSDTVAGLRNSHPDTLIMADCGSADDARAAQDAGVDVLGTTLAGYSGARPKTEGPDWELLTEILDFAAVPVIVEGRVHNPGQAAEAISRGAHSVVVGTAITHPTTITSWFADAVRDSGRS